MSCISHKVDVLGLKEWMCVSFENELILEDVLCRECVCFTGCLRLIRSVRMCFSSFVMWRIWRDYAPAGSSEPTASGQHSIHQHFTLYSATQPHDNNTVLCDEKLIMIVLISHPHLKLKAFVMCVLTWPLRASTAEIPTTSINMRTGHNHTHYQQGLSRSTAVPALSVPSGRKRPSGC